MDPAKVKIPPMQDLTIENITENTILINSQGPDKRLEYVLERLVTHMHDFARETRLSTKEWMAGIMFLTAVGQICSDVRQVCQPSTLPAPFYLPLHTASIDTIYLPQEFILLSDILGLSLLVDSIDHPKPPHSTEGSVLGPFHTHDAEALPHGHTVSHDPLGEPCLVLITVKDVHGTPISDVKVDIWETDSSGHYDVQYADRKEPDGRCVMKSDANGALWFKAIKPVPYPIPHDGPVGQLLEKVHRHPYRPSHMHFMFEKEGWDHLITALYLRGDPYETSDAVFGVKQSLVVNLHPADYETAHKYGVETGTLVLKHDFVLVSEKAAKDLRDERSRAALAKLGRKVKLLDGLPVPDVD
ncbi:hypothetical protein MMC19_003818 [Ptychographa xylographoides]|nr:hypothetical protein [Ptychographa xylographoides]